MSAAAPKTKLFVLDTNVILHDANCWRNFEEHDVAVPITVLEELDQFKRGNRDINAMAREFLRSVDEMVGDVLSKRGASRGPDQGNLRVVVGGAYDETLRGTFQQDTPDHRILNCAVKLQNETKDRLVVLVSKDTNLRMKAKSLGVVAQDYIADKVRNVEELYRGKRIVDDLPSEPLVEMLGESGRVAASELGMIEQPVANEHFVLRSGTMSVLSTYEPAELDGGNGNPGGGSFVRVHKESAYGVRPRNAEQVFALHALMDDRVQLVTLAGKAGTGKTLLALAAALECRKRYRQILLARPIVPLSNRDLGFLPGDVDAKIDPYMQPLFDNLAVIRSELGDNEAAAQKLAKLRETEKLVITPLAYIRGRTLQRCFFIVDEAQNLTPHEVKTIITRAGEGTKIVLTGDIRQIDQPYLDALSNGLSYVIDRMKGQPLYAHVTLEKGERSLLSDLASQLL
jgi:PhoH-like ATPase